MFRGEIIYPSFDLGPALREFFKKVPYYREKGPGVQGKRWPKYSTEFLALGLGVVLYLPVFLVSLSSSLRMLQGTLR